MSSSSEPADSTKSGEVSWVTVQFKEDVTESQIQSHHAHVSKLCEGPLAARSEAYHGHYGHLNHVFKGYTGQYPKAIIEEIKKSPEVSVVETSSKSKNWKDLTYKTIDKQDWTMSKISNLNPAFTTQESNGDFIYSYPADWGKGVIIFVLERKFKANDVSYYIMAATLEVGFDQIHRYPRIDLLSVPNTLLKTARMILMVHVLRTWQGETPLAPPEEAIYISSTPEITCQRL